MFSKVNFCLRVTIRLVSMFTQAHISMDRIEEMMAKQKFASSTTLYNEQFSLNDLYIFEYRTHY